MQVELAVGKLYDMKRDVMGGDEDDEVDGGELCAVGRGVCV